MAAKIFHLTFVCTVCFFSVSKTASSPFADFFFYLSIISKFFLLSNGLGAKTEKSPDKRPSPAAVRGFYLFNIQAYPALLHALFHLSFYALPWMRRDLRLPAWFRLRLHSRRDRPYPLTDNHCTFQELPS